MWVYLLQVKPLLQVTRQEEELSVKEEELQKAKDSAQKFETELKDITLKHTQVRSRTQPDVQVRYLETPAMFRMDTVLTQSNHGKY